MLTASTATTHIPAPTDSGMHNSTEFLWLRGNLEMPFRDLEPATFVRLRLSRITHRIQAALDIEVFGVATFQPICFAQAPCV